MRRLQNMMLLRVHARDPLRGGRAPGQEDNAARPALRDGVDDLLREALPAVAGVAVGLVRAHGQAGVQQEDAAIGPGGEQAAAARRRFEGCGKVVLQAGVDVLERGWGGRGWANGEGEPVGLVDVVVGVLAEDDDFDGRERGVTGPVCRARVRLGVAWFRDRERERSVAIYVCGFTLGCAGGGIVARE